MAETVGIIVVTVFGIVIMGLVGKHAIDAMITLVKRDK